ALASWRNHPHYFLLHRVSADGVMFRAGPEICNFVPADAQVTVSSEDGYVRGSAVWPQIAKPPEAPAPKPPEPSPDPTRMIMLLILLAIAFVGFVGLLNARQLAEYGCDSLGIFCSPERLSGARDKQAFDTASKCADEKEAASQFCDVAVCFNDYLANFREGKY